jgi:CheY-like chemotaxis protein
MPEMDGIELARQVKELLSDSTTIVMISAVEWSHIEASATAAGVSRFIPKPLFNSAIIDCISECVGAEINDLSLSGIIMKNRYKDKIVLLAEDVEINREIIIAMLAETGVVIEYAENGIQAVNMFSNAPDRYDLILMDVHMPDMNGLEATAHIRALNIPQASLVPIVAMTANVFREDVDRCLEAGMNNHVGKPIDIEDVVAKMDLYL